MRLTKKREELLAVLKHHHGALSATTLHEKLPHIDLVTIYRNLELFTEEKIIKRLHLHSNEAVYEYQSHPHHHAVCSDCDTVLHFDVSEDVLRKLVTLKNFDIESVELVVTGRCKNGTKAR